MSFSIEQLQIGQTASFEKTITEADVILFSGVSGDINPVHIDELAAQKSIFGRRVAHGVLVSSLTSSVLGMQLPGKGTIYLAQENRFKAPVFIGDTVKASVKVTELRPEKNVAILKTTTTNQDGRVVVEGVATVMPPKHA